MKTALRWIYLFFVITLNPGCAYRFSNSYVQTIGNIRTVAVEGVFDTSKDVVPHEVFWESLQRSLARDGHLVLTDRDDADALLRIHITAADVRPTGAVKPISGPTKDPKVAAGEQIDPSLLRQLTVAGFFTELESVTALVTADLIDLRNGGILMEKKYSGVQNFRSARSESVFPLHSSYLYYSEASHSAYRKISDQIAQQITGDLLIRW